MKLELDNDLSKVQKQLRDYFDKQGLGLNLVDPQQAFSIEDLMLVSFTGVEINPKISMHKDALTFKAEFCHKITGARVTVEIG